MRILRLESLEAAASHVQLSIPDLEEQIDAMFNIAMQYATALHNAFRSSSETRTIPTVEFYMRENNRQANPGSLLVRFLHSARSIGEETTIFVVWQFAMAITGRGKTWFKPDASLDAVTLTRGVLSIMRQSAGGFLRNDNHNFGHGIWRRLQYLAEYVVMFMILPIRSNARRTPKPAPECDSNPTVDFRLLNLRARCLARDGNKCLLTGKRSGIGNGKVLNVPHTELIPFTPIHNRGRETYDLECAHIIPPALNYSSSKLGSGSAAWKATIWTALNSFYPGLSEFLRGSNIEKPANTLMLTADAHSRFSRLELIVKEIEGYPGYFELHKVSGEKISVAPDFDPQCLRLKNNSPENIDLPDPHLLRIHALCGELMHLTGHAHYIESLMEEYESGEAKTDGSTDIRRLICVGLAR